MPRPHKYDFAIGNTLSSYFDKRLDDASSQHSSVPETMCMESLKELMISEFNIVTNEMQVVRQDIKSLAAEYFH